MTRVEGATLHVGDSIVDPVDGVTIHRIDSLTEYPGRCCGDHLRRAHGDHWDATIADSHLYQLVRAAQPVAA
ncbi:hypothetical protein GCM10010399_64120 [Dactylosporangium fulvum]|uniref:Uncharacterized protein n=1 Tax=Dactylosporangium fulvum TaxID=53359 RepID=A0ABY5W6X6_9ACTN|nr:hypothetical protein [Dactylosporangium fulvum]UWP85765.1 hypothetical protein Dfulv_16595 [Dactylosporangium fulvum]